MRRILGTRKVGHAGTLDPMATGVLIILANGATKLSEKYMNGDKVYRAAVRLGVVTDTYDTTGKIISENEVSVTRGEIDGALAGFVGEISQTPPMYSAVKVNGRKLYELARRGIEVERKSRDITVYKIDVVDYRVAGVEPIRLSPILFLSERPFRRLNSDGYSPSGKNTQPKKLSGERSKSLKRANFRPSKKKFADNTFVLAKIFTKDGWKFAVLNRVGFDSRYPNLTLDIHCSKGTYVRSLIHDFGQVLGCGAAMSGLCRLRSGDFSIDDAVTLEDLQNEQDNFIGNI